MIPGNRSQWEYTQLMFVTSSSSRSTQNSWGSVQFQPQCHYDGCLHLFTESQLSRFCVRPKDHSCCQLHRALLDLAEWIVFPVSGKSLFCFTFSFKIKVDVCNRGNRMRNCCQGQTRLLSTQIWIREMFSISKRK